MMHTCKAWLPALLLGWGCLVAPAATGAAGEKKKEAADDVLFQKSESVTEDDEKDTKIRKSHRKVYSVKMTEGEAYRIDLSSKDFDTFLRLENANGKELAFNDDIDARNLNSRLIFLAPKTGSYKLIVTSFDGKTGAFDLKMKLASKDEAADARADAEYMGRVQSFATSTPAEQKKLVGDLTKHFQGKGARLSLKDAQMAAIVASQLDEDDLAFARSSLPALSKAFAASSDENVAAKLPEFIDGLLKKLNMIGKDIEIVGKTTDGKDFNLKNMKGKVVLVDFWATWCGPCIAEIPNIVKAHEKYHGKGFEVIGVSLDRKDEAITEFLEAKKLPWASINIEDSRKLANKYDVHAIPQPILVGRDGRIISMRARGPALERLLEQHLEKK